MLRTVTLATIAALAAGPAFAYDCNSSKNKSAGYSAQSASTTYGQASYAQPIAAQPTYVSAQPVMYQDFAAPAQPAIQYVTATPDIVDTAVSAGSFNTLVAAVKAAGLVDTLKGPGPFTVFAPSDAAFAALPSGTVESLLLPENRDKLTAILTYHVVPGKILSGDLAGQRLSAATVQGQSVPIDATAGVRVGSANVVTADIETSNGVIHVIDSVLIPAS